jgi:Uma2 family endonuclease
VIDETVYFDEPHERKPKRSAAAKRKAVEKKAPDASHLPIFAIDLPVLFEDEGQEEMGEHTIHTLTDDIISLGLESHLQQYPNHHVFSNLNLHYHPINKKSYVSPDEMVIVADFPPRPSMGSYRVGETGPAPVLTVEVLSRRTYQQQDTSPTGKPVIYAELGVQEYIQVDVTGEFLPQRLVLKRLNESVQDEAGIPTWLDEQDPDGGVTSQLGFRLIIEADGDVRVLDAHTGQGYLRPEEVEATRRQAEQRVAESEQRATEQEVARQQAEQRAAEQEAARQQAEQRAAEQETARQQAEQRAAEQETARQQAEQRAAEQEAARQQAEQRAAEAEQHATAEAAARQALEDRMAQMEAEMERFRRGS